MSHSSQMPTCLITGGARGFLGQRLVATLLERGYRVRNFDLLPPATPCTHPRHTFYQGDLRNYDEVAHACAGVDLVFHVASMIIPSGTLPQKKKEELYDVNVGGTHNVINACLKNGVSKLIYTSSNNVVLDKPIADGDETLPYAATFIDHYTKSKVLAEKAILAANGQSGLLTCALRPGGIYGPGDAVFLPKLLEACKKGMPLWRIGDGSALADNVYVDDLAEAHVLAAEKLTPGSVVCGQAYFISDGCPTNYFDFIGPIIQKLGFTASKRSIPYSVAYAVGWACEWVDCIKKPSRVLSRLSVVKLGAHNYFNIDKARLDLGYAPKISRPEGIERCLPYCREILNKIEIVSRPRAGWWIAVFSGMTLLALLAWGWNVLPLKLLFGAAVLVHLAEACYAFKKASQAKLSTARGWFVQTFLLGYPSLRLLLKRIKNEEGCV